MAISSNTNSIAKSKAKLRVEAKRWRRNLTEHERKLASRIISQKLEEIDWSRIKTLHTYLPIKEQNEIDTLVFLRWLWSQHPHITTYTSVFKDSGTKMKIVRIATESQLQTNLYGIPEPFDPEYVSDDQSLDVIIVPCLQFDASNNRLGYGGGNYDKFLAQHKSANKIGLCYRELYQDQLPVDDWDVQLDRVITQ